MVKTGELAIIPIGFRCFTKSKMREILNISQASLPFDSGFFSPKSIASVIKYPKIDLNFNENYMDNHTVCKKYENYNDKRLGKGIKFQKSTYDEINSIVIGKDNQDMNKYLDTTYGYYTLDIKHKFVLAHYNWHKLADDSKSQGITEPKLNLEKINNIMNKRLERMFDMCNSAKYIIFMFMENQGYKYMMLDDEVFPLNDLTEIEQAVENKFAIKPIISTLDELNSAEKILEVLKISV
jgi:hypothetical protein